MREVRYEQVVLVDHCVRSIVEHSTYENYEIVCVVDDATPTRACSTSCARSRGDRLRLVAFDRPFNFSAKINLGAVRSEGEHLLLLNDDIEVVDAGLDRADGDVLGASTEVGAVGGRLLWEDGRLQHVGVAASRTAAARATSTAASPATSGATRTTS